MKYKKEKRGVVRCHFIERFQCERNLFLETQTEEVGGALRDEVGRLGYQIRNVSCFNDSRRKKREPVHTSLSRQSVLQFLSDACCSLAALEVRHSQDLMDRQFIVRLYYLVGCLCVSVRGWQRGIEYVYEYNGRLVTSVWDMKQQFATVEMLASLHVQSVDNSTLIMKLSDVKIRRQGNCQGNPYYETNDGANDQISLPIEIGGDDVQIIDIDKLQTPFEVKHLLGSMISLSVGANEPFWISNMKKSIVTLLQLDVTGVRSEEDVLKLDDELLPLTVYEDGVTGDCLTTMQFNRLPSFQVIGNQALHQGGMDEVCKNTGHVYEITKIKDFDRCRSNPFVSSATPPLQSTCRQLGGINCDRAIQRAAVYKYIGCGASVDQLTIARTEGFGELFVKPFGIKTEQIVNTAIISLVIQTTNRITKQFNVPSPLKVFQNLAYTFTPTDILRSMDRAPDLTSGPNINPIDINMMKKSTLTLLRNLSQEIRESSTSDRDVIERVSIISRTMTYFSLDGLRFLWTSVKGNDSVVQDLFVDCLTGAGTNPTVMMIKEMIEKQEIKGYRAVWTATTLGSSIQTPTKALFQQLMLLVKSNAVQSSKPLKQSLLISLADLFYTACNSSLTRKRFPSQVYSGFSCDLKEPIVTKEFLELLKTELKEAGNSTADRYVTLTTVGLLGIEEVIPVLLPHIHGDSKDEDTAGRMRAIFSLHRVIKTSPGKVLPLVMAVADNPAQRPELRMAAINLLMFNEETPIAIWQKLAYRTWFEPSHQVQSFTHSLLVSLSSIPPQFAVHRELSRKARIVLDLARAGQQGLLWSGSSMYSALLDHPTLGTIGDIPFITISDAPFPAVIGLHLFNQFGPFILNPLAMSLWSYEMEDVWNQMLDRLSGNIIRQTPHIAATIVSGTTSDLKNLWKQFGPERRPVDKRLGIFHARLMGSIHRIIDLEKEFQNFPKTLADLMSSIKVGLPIRWAKYQKLLDFRLLVPTDMGLATHVITSVPVMASIDGHLQNGANGTVDFSGATLLSVKLSSEVRSPLPFAPNGQYIGAGVDVRLDLRAPQRIGLRYHKGSVRLILNATDQRRDLFYYHVRPYTISRGRSDEFTPTVEYSGHHPVSVSDPVKSDADLNQFLGPGINLRWQSSTELPDQDILTLLKTGLVPLSLHDRSFRLRYSPQVNQVQSIQFSLQHATQTKFNPLAVQMISGTGERVAKNSNRTNSNGISADEVDRSISSINQRLFQNFDGGESTVLIGSLAFQWKNQSHSEHILSMGYARNDNDTKDVINVRLEHKSFQNGKPTQQSPIFCASGFRTWDRPPLLDLSPDSLQLNGQLTVNFGSSCSSTQQTDPGGSTGERLQVNIQMMRDSTAAAYARTSSSHQQCEQLRNDGWIDSAPCAESRALDRTYNVYDMVIVSNSMPNSTAYLNDRPRRWLDHLLSRSGRVTYRCESNVDGRLKISGHRDPSDGHVQWTLRFPRETLQSDRFELTGDNRFLSAFFPVQARSNVLGLVKKIVTSGLSEVNCYIGANEVTTYDQVTYGYTFNQCYHVLVTDCWMKNRYAVTAKNDNQNRKMVHVILEKDIIDIDPAGSVSINGLTHSLKNNSRVLVRDDKSILAIVTSHNNGSIIRLQLPSHEIQLTMKGPHITLSAPWDLRGRACGLCGDFNQEVSGEFKTASRCALSSGSLMAASFQVEADDDCPKLDQEVQQVLKQETRPCSSVDQQVTTISRMSP